VIAVGKEVELDLLEGAADGEIEDAFPGDGGVELSLQEEAGGAVTGEQGVEGEREGPERRLWPPGQRSCLWLCPASSQEPPLHVGYGRAEVSPSRALWKRVSALL
jgi:hypothetical protein